jgi:flagellar hook-associated protein 1 FlgK
MTGALQIGRSALLAYQSALQVVGNNIANVGSASYTRQSPLLAPANGVRLPEGFTPGGGVALASLKRNVDASLENRIRYAVGDQGDALVQQQVLGRIEAVLNELTDGDLSTLLQEFFNSFEGLQNEPHDGGARGVVLTAGAALAREIQRQRADSLALRDELNRQIESAAGEADRIARDIARINSQIVEVESTGYGGANSLRDQRDELLRQLANFAQIEVREQPNGSINVYVGNEPLIQDGFYRGLTTETELTNGQPRTVVRFSDNNGLVALGGGQIGGMMASRDQHVMGHVDELNALAAALIREVNKVHARGRGLVGFTDVTGDYDVLDPDAALNSAAAGLGFAPQNGSFTIAVRNQTSGLSNSAVITVDLDGIGADDTLATLVAQLNAKVGNVTAEVTPDNRLRLRAADGFEIAFSEDSSNALAALGINTFFNGSDAQDITISTLLEANPDLIAAGAGTGAAGDGANAAALAALAETSLGTLGGRSLTEYYNTIASNIAVKGSAATAGVQAADLIWGSLTAQRESISGVSLDEETISLLRLERAFQGAARYSSTVDRLIQETLQLVG